MKYPALLAVTVQIAVISLLPAARSAAAKVRIPLYDVHEVVFEGPALGPTDAPARDVELVTRWQHENAGPVYEIHGFWDGDGQGGAVGNVFKVRFCPSVPGTWTLVETVSNRPELAGQRQGYTVTCVPSERPGF